MIEIVKSPEKTTGRKNCVTSRKKLACSRLFTVSYCAATIYSSQAFAPPSPNIPLHIGLDCNRSFRSKSSVLRYHVIPVNSDEALRNMRDHLSMKASLLTPVDDTIFNSLHFRPSIERIKVGSQFLQLQSRNGGFINGYTIPTNSFYHQITHDKYDSHKKNSVLGFDLKINMVSRSVESDDIATYYDDDGRSRSKNSDGKIDIGKKSKVLNHSSISIKDATDAIDITSSYCISPIKKKVIQSLLNTGVYNDAMLRQELEENNLGKSTSRTSIQNNVLKDQGSYRKKYERSSVPAWFPYIPTQSQIEALKVKELKMACSERGLKKSGNKADLQMRLLMWTNEQNHRRVSERRKALRPQCTTYDVVNDLIHSHEKNNSPYSNDGPAQLDTPYGPGSSIEPLINRRKAMLRNKDRSKKKYMGTLGFVADSSVAPSMKGDKNSSDIVRSVDSSVESVIGEHSRRQRIKRSKNVHTMTPEEEGEDVEVDYIDVNVDDKRGREYISTLTESFYKNSHDELDPSSKHITNNYQVKQLYLRAKFSDQAGDLKSAKKLLHQLRRVSPNDTRVISRLARIEMQASRVHEARKILHDGLRIFPNNANFLHSLGQIENVCGYYARAKYYFSEAIRYGNAGFANPFHALGTLEHSRGNIRSATAILRSGIKRCPLNHRLHHALGDLYREAKMLDLADASYRRGLDILNSIEKKQEVKRNWSKSFFYTALAYLSYDKRDYTNCRSMLKRAVDVQEGNILHSQGWLSLAQFEESQGQIDVAKLVYSEATNVYEESRGLNKVVDSRYQMVSKGSDPKAMTSRLGDLWLNVYVSWARFEEKYGSFDDVNNAYARAAMAFPNDWRILLGWARLLISGGRIGRARTLFEIACDKAGDSNADPYRLYAEFEMSHDNHF
mmetsp:Transcript_20772/g.29167  ORF Transcript_20772/g.29167 Transcript_20772/m.29167 type:complete len:898 (+) Transcript_20772:162-2855(+)